MASKTKTEQPAAAQQDSAGREEGPGNAADAAAAPTAQASASSTSRKARPPIRMRTSDGDGDGGGDPGDGDGGDGSQDDGLPEEFQSTSSAKTSELRVLLERSRPRQKDNTNGTNGRQRASLGTVKLDSFEKGHRAYKQWRKMVIAEQRLYRLEDEELSMLVYKACKGEARDVLDQMEIEEMISTGGLPRMWLLLDEAFGEPEDDKFEAAEGLLLQHHETGVTYRREGAKALMTPLKARARAKAKTKANQHLLDGEDMAGTIKCKFLFFGCSAFSAF